MRPRHRLTALPLQRRRWDDEELFSDSAAFYRSLLSAIAAARRQIDVEVYIFRDDSLGRTVIDALSDASRRGLSVRVLVDGIGSLGYIRSIGARLEAAGVAFRVYKGLPWKNLHSPAYLTRHLGVLRAFIERINARDHRKVWLIDSQEMWSGSMNVADVHMPPDGSTPWFDLGVRVRGPDVSFVQQSFDLAWRTRGWFDGPGVAAPAEAPLALSDSRRTERVQYRRLLYRIRTARERVYILTAYFVPNGSLISAVRAAASAGVDVRIIVPRRSDLFFMPWVTAGYYSSLLDAGARIYEFCPAVLHAKAVLIDGHMVVGSSNVNYRSMLLDREIDVLLTSESAKAKLTELFSSVQSECQAVTPELVEAIPAWKRLMGSALVLFRRWL